jgi:hypothetical protein
MLSSGAIVDEGSRLSPSALTPGSPTFRDEIIVSLLDVGGGAPVEVARAPGPVYTITSAVLPDGSETFAFGGGLDERFGSLPSFAFGADRVLRADPGTFEVRDFSATGELQTVLRILTPRKSLTPAMIADYEALVLDRAGGSPDARARLDEISYADSMPHFGDVMVDTEGHVWVSEYYRHRIGDPRVDDIVPQRWWRLSKERGVDGYLHFPEGFSPLFITDSEVFGAIRDALDVPYLARYGLVPREPPR